MKPAAIKINHLSKFVRVLLGGFLITSLLACSSGGGSGFDDADPEPKVPVFKPSPGTEDVVWTELVNVTVSGTTLKKTGGCDGCLDAGAVSEQTVGPDSGFLEFPVTDTSKIRYIGFNPNSTTVRPTEITFGLKLVNGHAEVKEDGQFRADIAVAVGDVLRIAVNSGVITYIKNDDVFYTSTVTMNLPLHVDTSFISMGSTLSNVRVKVAGSSVSSAGSGSKNVLWTDLVNVTAGGAGLRKTGGCDGCEDAGAVSRQQLASGGGHLDFTVAETGPELYIGLNNGSAGTAAAEMPYAIRLVDDRAEVREHGQYRANITVGSGDVLRIAVRAGVVSYARNGAVFYTSAAAASYPLRADTSLINSGATLSNARIAGFSEDGSK